MSSYQVFLLGAPRIEFNLQSVAVDTRKALALLAFLIVSGEPQSRDTVAAFLWPESDQTLARAALRRTLSTLRRALDKDMVDFGREVIALKPEAGLWCDVTAFRAHLENYKNHNHAEDQVCMRCQAPLTEAAEIYRGDFLAGFSLRDSVEFDNWQFMQAEQLRRELSEVLDKLVLIHGTQRDYSAALEYARRWLSLDQLNEAAHRTLINLYALNGQRNAALHQYRECVRILDQELGVAPLEETTQLYEDVKENHVTELIIYKHLLGIFPEQVPAPPNNLSYPGGDLSPTSDLIPLIGRSQELEQLKRIYEGIRQNGFLIVLTGEAGIGKTRLAHEFLSQLQSRGTTNLSTQCYAGESNLTFSPLIDLLRQGIKLSGDQKWWQGVNPHMLSEVSRLLPELSDIIPDLPSSQLIDGPGAQSRFYEGICQTLEAMVAGPSPGIPFIVPVGILGDRAFTCNDHLRTDAE
jgi:DNA-binding SARP family transcriptional activator